MREQLVQYVNLLFAGTSGTEEIQQEILQNTLDRYDDLIAQGKQPEAAYRLAISGIGDISEILGEKPLPASMDDKSPSKASSEDPNSRLRTAVAVAMYILCPVPLFILGDVGNGAIGLSMMCILIAGATALLIMNRDEKEDRENTHSASQKNRYAEPHQELKKSIGNMIWAIGLALYFLISFMTQAWAITWIIFPLIAAVNGLVRAILDLKEANKHEN